MKRYQTGGELDSNTTPFAIDMTKQAYRPLREGAMPTGIASINEPVMGRRYFENVTYGSTPTPDLQPAIPVTPVTPVTPVIPPVQKEKGIASLSTGPSDADIRTAVRAIKTEYGNTPAGYERLIKAMTNYGVSPDRLAGIIGTPADAIRKYVNDYYGKTGVFALPAKRQPEEVTIEDDFGEPPKLLEQAPTTGTKAPEGPTDTEIRRLIDQAKSQYGTGAEGIKALVGAMKNVGITPQRMADIMGIPLSQVQRAYDKYAGGGTVRNGLASLMQRPRGYYLGGTTDGMADDVPATINGSEPARLSDGEFVIPADVVSHLGNGNSDAGAKQLYSMMDRVREARTGTTKQGAEINPRMYLS